MAQASVGVVPGRGCSSSSAASSSSRRFEVRAVPPQGVGAAQEGRDELEAHRQPGLVRGGLIDGHGAAELCQPLAHMNK
jgi:hypothetical protein